jgi:hypothetical protein
MRDFEVPTAVDCLNVNVKTLRSSNASVTAYHSARRYTEETFNFFTSSYNCVQSSSVFDELCTIKIFLSMSGSY